MAMAPYLDFHLLCYIELLSSILYICFQRLNSNVCLTNHLLVDFYKQNNQNYTAFPFKDKEEAQAAIQASIDPTSV